jgi:hypothetical protein
MSTSDFVRRLTLVRWALLGTKRALCMSHFFHKVALTTVFIDRDYVLYKLGYNRAGHDSIQVQVCYWYNLASLAIFGILAHFI